MSLLETYTGWWYTYPSEKYEFVSWDDEIPHIRKNEIHVPNHEPVHIFETMWGVFNIRGMGLILSTVN